MAKTYAVCEKCGQMNRVEIKSDKEAVCGSCKTALPIHGAVVDASDATFKKLVANSPIPVVVDVWASWCGPCRAFAPVFKETSEKFAGRLVFIKLDSEASPQTAGELGIRSIPSILVFKNGREVARQSGALPREQFAQWLEPFTR
jgi:thioredoxin 2